MVVPPDTIVVYGVAVADGAVGVAGILTAVAIEGAEAVTVVVTVVVF